MKIPFTFFLLFATQIIPLNAEIYGKKNALVPGSLRPQLKFWRNPFSSSKAKPENEKESVTGTFRVRGTATLKNGKIELDISLGNEIAPETGLMPPASETTAGATIKPTASGPTSSAGTTTPSESSTSASATPPQAGGSTIASSTPTPPGGSSSAGGTTTPTGGSTSASGTPPSAGGSTSASVTPPSAGGSTSASVTPPSAGGSTSASGTPPPAGGSTSASVTPPPAGGSTSASVTPPPAGGSTSTSVTPPPAGGSTSASVTPPPAGGSTSASVTPPPAGGSTSTSVTPPPAGGSTSTSVTPPPAGGSTSTSVTPPPAGGSTTASVTPPAAGGSTPASTTAPGSSTLPTSKPTSATPPTPATAKPTVPLKICIAPGQVYVIIVAKGVMAAHNSVRRTHGSPALRLDEQMTCDAQHFAQQMASRGVLEHQKSSILARKRMGENIGMSCTPARNGPLSFQKIKRMVGNVAKRWYDEVCDYNFDKPSFAPRVGHFTEVVWSNSRKLGVGYAVGKNARFPGYACVYVVGRYRPAGNNMESQRLEANVKRGNFNNAYCSRRSKAPAFTLIPVEKRNQLSASRRARP